MGATSVETPEAIRQEDRRLEFAGDNVSLSATGQNEPSPTATGRHTSHRLDSSITDMAKTAEQLNLSFLMEHERDIILKVLQKDEKLRKLEEKRIR